MCPAGAGRVCGVGAPARRGSTCAHRVANPRSPGAGWFGRPTQSLVAALGRPAAAVAAGQRPTGQPQRGRCRHPRGAGPPGRGAGGGGQQPAAERQRRCGPRRGLGQHTARIPSQPGAASGLGAGPVWRPARRRQCRRPALASRRCPVARGPRGRGRRGGPPVHRLARLPTGPGADPGRCPGPHHHRPPDRRARPCRLRGTRPGRPGAGQCRPRPRSGGATAGRVRRRTQSPGGPDRARRNRVARPTGPAHENRCSKQFNTIKR